MDFLGWNELVLFSPGMILVSLLGLLMAMLLERLPVITLGEESSRSNSTYSTPSSLCYFSSFSYAFDCLDRFDFRFFSFLAFDFFGEIAMSDFGS